MSDISIRMIRNSRGTRRQRTTGRGLLGESQRKSLICAKTRYRAGKRCVCHPSLFERNSNAFQFLQFILLQSCSLGKFISQFLILGKVYFVSWLHSLYPFQPRYLSLAPRTRANWSCFTAFDGFAIKLFAELTVVGLMLWLGSPWVWQLLSSLIGSFSNAAFCPAYSIFTQFTQIICW